MKQQPHEVEMEVEVGCVAEALTDSTAHMHAYTYIQTATLRIIIGHYY